MLQLLCETLPGSAWDFESILDDKSKEPTFSLALFSIISVFDRVQVNSFRNVRPSISKQPVQLTKCQGAKGAFMGASRAGLGSDLAELSSAEHPGVQGTQQKAAHVELG